MNAQLADADVQRTRLRPQNAPGLQTELNIAIRYHQEGQLRLAAAVCEMILRCDPNHANALHLLGAVALQEGDAARAEELIGRAAQLQPNNPAILCHLARAQRELGRHPQAVASYRAALRLQPNNADAANDLGLVLFELREYQEAVGWFQAAVRLLPHAGEVHSNLGNALTHLGNSKQAITSFREAVRLLPPSLELQINLANALREHGRFDEATACFREVLRLDPGHSGALGHLAILERGNLGDNEFAAIQRQIDDPSLANRQRAALHFGLAQVLDARSDFQQASEHLRHANALTLAHWRERGEHYDPNEQVKFVDDMIGTCTPQFFERTRGFGLTTELPIFVFGLPRSGTTLIEQILASHSQVFGAGELQLASDTFDALPEVTGRGPSPIACLSGLSPQETHTLARRHLDRLVALVGASDCGKTNPRRIVDKMPGNYLQLGLLATLFPRAKFIHCRRDLRDVAFSCWMTNFKEVRWASATEDIASQFAQYRRIMNYWQGLLPVPVLDVIYEDTVADLEGTARKLIDWCGLAWESECLSFHKTQRPVKTASLAQVRRPIYKSSVARWKHYEPYLADLFSALPES